jgi:hypothetical protein
MRPSRILPFVVVGVFLIGREIRSEGKGRILRWHDGLELQGRQGIRGDPPAPSAVRRLARNRVLMRRAAVIGVILAGLAVTACGGGGASETIETSSGAPPRLVGLKSAFEHQVLKKNDVSALDCEDGQEPDVMASLEVWDCELTMTQTDDSLEIEALVGVSSGSYTVLACRRSPEEKYSQAPHGICEQIR